MPHRNLFLAAVLSKGQCQPRRRFSEVDGRWAPPRGRCRSTERRHRGRLPGNQLLGATTEKQEQRVPCQYIVCLGSFIPLEHTAECQSCLKPRIGLCESQHGGIIIIAVVIIIIITTLCFSEASPSLAFCSLYSFFLQQQLLQRQGRAGEEPCVQGSRWPSSSSQPSNVP